VSTAREVGKGILVEMGTMPMNREDEITGFESRCLDPESFGDFHAMTKVTWKGEKRFRIVAP
jgi:hypothetical protein